MPLLAASRTSPQDRTTTDSTSPWKRSSAARTSLCHGTT
eukprot:CAMPEP_0169433056 /NCGR_PEP_ID=MMETSP1042-20121227/3809_1 /TAXON_ID=464988 /ORGANISM="Hemiselmis andersenii, Strain CCMP1180" /LENGTH=38 /DNA_ID= /DNA_START= /DNA_END= /DNA_ORIENTATION=